MGREVIHEKDVMVASEQQFTYDILDLESGIYFVTVSSDESRAVSRFIKD